MTDPNNTNPTQDPQDVIDQALTGVATPAPLPTPEPLSPTTPTTPAAPMPSTSTPDETVPTELTVDTPTASETVTLPLPPTPELPTPQPLTPDLPPEPPRTEAVGDDMPLAFAGATVESAPIPASAPVVESVTPFVPPVLTSSPTDSGAPKKKGKMSKVMMAIVGFFLFSGLVSGVGLYTYNRYGTLEPATIAAVNGKNKDTCNGCSKPKDGGNLVWRNGACVVVGICNSSNPNKNTTPPPNNSAPQGEAACKAAGGAWCVGCGGFCNMTKDQGCYNLQAAKCGEGQPLGATRVACDGKEVKKCKCGGGISQCFDKTGYCGDEQGLSDQTRLSGLCAITPNPLYKADPNCNETNKLNCPAIPTTGSQQGGDDGIADWFNDVKNSGALKNSYYCPGMTSNVSAGCSIPGTPPNLNCFCGTIQIDTGLGFESKTMKCGCDKSEDTPNPSPSPSPSTPVTSSLMCVGITKTPSKTPAIGDTFTFTCQGSSVPAGSINLSYKFRYSLNSGAYVTISNATATTADLVIAACGSYKVQCQACGTINGATVCDPDWAAATGN